MDKRMLNFSISLLLCLLTIWPDLPAQVLNGPSAQRGQTNQQRSKEKEKTEPEVVYPLYNGLSVGIDLWGLGGKVFGSDFVSSEVAVDVNLKNRYFPTVEMGFGSTDAWSDNGIHYKSSAPYFRIGADYNTMYKKKHGNMLLVGLRLAGSSFKYDVMTPTLDDPIYGGNYGNPNLEDDIWNEAKPAFDHKGMKGSMIWGEFCAGIRALVHKNIYMGWAVRYRFKLTASSGEYGVPWYVPGFGKYGDNTLGITYTITYKLPTQAK